jgi:DNA-binding NarL/FixJ family response regulator
LRLKNNTKGAYGYTDRALCAAGKMKVLIVDDSGAVRERIKMLLSEVSTVDTIGEAENAREAIEHIRQQGPDVVILDIRMPGGNGIDVLREIKKRNRLPVIIMLTNFPYSQYRKRCMDAGADYFFDKSREFEKVVEVLSGSMQQTSNDPIIFS